MSGGKAELTQPEPIFSFVSQIARQMPRTVTNAAFFNNTSSLFQRDFSGTVATASFQLKNSSGGNVAASTDPFFFSGTSSDIPAVPEPGSLSLLATSLIGLTALRRRARRPARHG